MERYLRGEEAAMVCVEERRERGKEGRIYRPIHGRIRHTRDVDGDPSQVGALAFGNGLAGSAHCPVHFGGWASLRKKSNKTVIELDLPKSKEMFGSSAFVEVCIRYSFPVKVHIIIQLTPLEISKYFFSVMRFNNIRTKVTRHQAIDHSFKRMYRYIAN